MGEKEIDNNNLAITRRDNIEEKLSFSSEKLTQDISNILENIQDNIYNKALKFRNENILEINNLDNFKKHFSNKNPSFIICYSDPKINIEREELLKELKITARCIPFEFNDNNDE